MATEFDNTQARTEGWSIFDCDGSENGPWQLARIDSPEDWEGLGYITPKFESDVAAWAHVATRAALGSSYHAAALAFLQEHNPQEMAAIKAHIEGLTP